MRMRLVVNHGEYEFTNFNKAVVTLKEEYGYEGHGWELIVASGDLEILCDFLNTDGVEAELLIA